MYYVELVADCSCGCLWINFIL